VRPGARLTRDCTSLPAAREASICRRGAWAASRARVSTAGVRVVTWLRDRPDRQGALAPSVAPGRDQRPAVTSAQAVTSAGDFNPAAAGGREMGPGGGVTGRLGRGRAALRMLTARPVGVCRNVTCDCGAAG
jgi:hypothetical protein